jgi:hypothetical protein
MATNGQLRLECASREWGRMPDSPINADGWVLGPPRAISADGRVIAGNGTCAGVPSEYRLELPL